MGSFSPDTVSGGSVPEAERLLERAAIEPTASPFFEELDARTTLAGEP